MLLLALTYVTPQRVAIGKPVIALSVITLVLAGALGLVLVAPQSIMHPATTTTTTTTTRTIMSTSLNATTRVATGAEGQCGFTMTCGVLSPSGLELVLMVNSTAVRPNATMTFSVTELNVLSTTNNVSASSEWRLPDLRWLQGCGGPPYLPHGIELFQGYYTLGNVTSASPLAFWGAIPCGVGSIDYIGNVTSYAFQPNSDNASYSARQSDALKEYPPTSMLFGNGIYAGSVNEAPVNQLPSSAPTTYTLVAGDEWGALVLLHFSVT
jgi:hypothetical protein